MKRLESAPLALIVLLLPPLVAGCAMLRGGRPVLPDRATLVRGQLVIYSDFDLSSRHRLVEELAALRDEIRVTLGLPATDEPIYVYLFEQPKRYAAYMARFYPDLPNRRAFFVESDRRLTVYAHWGERVAEDLRHEVTHGYLHAVTPDPPLWLDEGIAEYFEVPRTQRGLNAAHVRLLSERLQRGQWQPDLRRLERLVSLVQTEQQDYAESWLWLHFLLESTPPRRQLLQDYLVQLSRGTPAPPLSSVLAQSSPDLGAALLEHLAGLQAAVPPLAESGGR